MTAAWYEDWRRRLAFRLERQHIEEPMIDEALADVVFWRTFPNKYSVLVNGEAVWRSGRGAVATQIQQVIEFVEIEREKGKVDGVLSKPQVEALLALRTGEEKVITDLRTLKALAKRKAVTGNHEVGHSLTEEGARLLDEALADEEHMQDQPAPEAQPEAPKEPLPSLEDVQAEWPGLDLSLQSKPACCSLPCAARRVLDLIAERIPEATRLLEIEIERDRLLAELPRK